MLLIKLNSDYTIDSEMHHLNDAFDSKVADRLVDPTLLNLEIDSVTLRDSPVPIVVEQGTLLRVRGVKPASKRE